MNMQTVSSSQIKEIGHDPETGTLAVRFNTGALYHYANVDAEKFSDFKSAESIGAHFGQRIKGAHSFERIKEEKKGD